MWDKGGNVCKVNELSKEFKMESFIGPYAKNDQGGFPCFPSILNGCTSADKEEYSRGKKKGFKVSKLTMKTFPTNRYDVILHRISDFNSR